MIDHIIEKKVFNNKLANSYDSLFLDHVVQQTWLVAWHNIRL
jgi:hypothetical protein